MKNPITDDDTCKILIGGARLQKLSIMNQINTNLLSDFIFRSLDLNEPMGMRFILLWIAFNGWIDEKISNKGTNAKDIDLVISAGYDPPLWRQFEKIKQNKAVNAFRNIWPIFRARSIVFQDQFETREHYVQRRYEDFKGKREAGKEPSRNFQPRCHFDHECTPPLDWAHTLWAIYQVRCNLFHGGKTLFEEFDIRLIDLAFRILSHVWFPALLYLETSPTLSCQSAIQNYLE